MVSAPSTGTSAAAAGKSAAGAATASNSSANGHVNGSGAPSKSTGYPVYASHIPLSMRKAPPLDMGTVEVRGTKTEVKDTDAPRTGRLPGLQEAPTFCPTEQEWQDPMEYMRKIAPEGRKYGICKIIPPDKWNPPFAIDTERFHFRTRRQELNSVEGSTRTNLNYLDQLSKFHKMRGMNLNRFPSVDKRPLDLYKLKKAVESRGGFDTVCKSKKWAEIGRDLGYSGKIMSSLSTSLKNSYGKWLQPYEDYVTQQLDGHTPASFPSLSASASASAGDATTTVEASPTPSPAHSPVKRSKGITTAAALASQLSSDHPVTPSGSVVPKVEGEEIDSVNATPTAAPSTNGLPPQVAKAAQAAAAPRGFTPVNLRPAAFQAVNANAQQQTQSHSKPDRRSGGRHSSNTAPGAGKQGSPAEPTSTSGSPALRDANGAAGTAGTRGRGIKRSRSLVNESPDRSESPSAVENGTEDGDRDRDRGRRSKRGRPEAAPTVVGSHMSMPRPSASSRMSSTAPRPAPKQLEGSPGERCEACGAKEDTSALIICDSCDNGYHKTCLDLPPKDDASDWHCSRCLVGTGDFGFEEGGIYSLKQFQEKANNFKRSYFKSKARPDTQSSSSKSNKAEVTEDQVEKEFWRLVESLTETVEVEYGADIHSTTAGSGFPDVERQPLDPYSSDPWNLNILPLVPESLFRHIKSDISGMTVPWLYVGMCFSTFCWHNEDHYTYSANYQHFGDTKTWYGIPGADADRFERAMKEAVPELFEQQPDLLFQLVTLLPPKQLQKAGVNVYALDQRAGQMVITFPQAYHAGFNHGFNFNEAVNFAPADWEPFGLAGVERLQEFQRQPCFSHDELLMTAAARDTSIKSAMWLGPALERMRSRELRDRQAFIQRHMGSSHTSKEATNGSHDCRFWSAPPQSAVANSCCASGFERDQGDLPEDEYNCSHCKAYCYLSRFVCKNSKKVLCLLHAGGVPCCEDNESERYNGAKHIVYYRNSNQELEELVDKVAARARIPCTWREKLDEELTGKSRPALKKLKTLLHEGERINWELDALPDLKAYVEKCEKWVEEATNFTVRKQQNRRKNERAWRREKGSKQTDPEDREKDFRNLENLHKLLAEADKLSFEDDAVTRLQERAQEVMDFQQDARSALHSPTLRLTEDLEELVEIGKAFNLDLPEIVMLEKVIKQLAWNDRAKDMQRSLQDIDSMTKLIKEGRDLGLPENDKYLVFFREQRAQGEQWEAKAKELVNAETINYQQLEALSTQAVNLPVSKDVRAQVNTILAKQREANAAVVSIYQKSQNSDFRRRPKYVPARDILASVSQVSKPSGTGDLEKEVRRHEDWMRRGKKLFGKSNAPLHILKSHMESVRDHNDFCLDLRDKPRMPVEPASREATPTSENDDAQPNASTRDVFCLCRQPESGMMIECELCREWYHSKCLKIARGKIKTEDKYTCPVCDWRVKIPRDAARPKLEDLQAWQAEMPDLPFQPEEEDVLQDIITKATEFRDFLRPFVNPVTSTPDEVPTQRFYLRKIEGAEILLAHETNFLRQELHKWAQVAPDPPPILEVSLSTRKPRPTKLQKMMLQMGVNNPDDLPPKLRTKAHTFKNKLESPKSKLPHPLQPAPKYSRSASVSNSTPTSATSNDGRNPSFRGSTGSGGSGNAQLFMGILNPTTTAAPSDITNPAATLSSWHDGSNGTSHDSATASPALPHSPIFRPATPPEPGMRAPIPPVDPSLFSPGAASHFGVSGAAHPSLISPMREMREFGPRMGSRDGPPSAHHGRNNSGGGSSNIGDLFADFTNDPGDDDGDRDSRNEAGEAIEALGFVGGPEAGPEDGASDAEHNFMT